MKSIALLLILLLNCDLTSSNIFILEKEDIEGTWYGVTKVESQIQPGYYTDQPVTILIQDRDSTMYSMQDTFNIYIEVDKELKHTGYIIGIEDEYEEYLIGTLYKNTLGGTANYQITLTLYHEYPDSLRVQFSNYDFRVGK